MAKNFGVLELSFGEMHYKHLIVFLQALNFSCSSESSFLLLVLHGILNAY